MRTRIKNSHAPLLDVIFPSLNDLDAWLDIIENEFDTQETTTFYIMDELKREGFLTDLLRHETEHAGTTKPF